MCKEQLKSWILFTIPEGGKPMSSYIKLNERAFNKGVDDILRLKPLQRVLQSVAGHKDTSHSAKSNLKGSVIVRGKKRESA